MLLGTHTPKLDDKGRVILPAKFRDQLAQTRVERLSDLGPLTMFFFAGTLDTPVEKL